MKQYTKVSKQTQSEMKKVQKRFEHWRKNKTQREIPQILWEAAIKLHPKYSPYEIAKALRLHYSKLKRLILEAQKKKTKSTEKKIDSTFQKTTIKEFPEEKQSTEKKVNTTPPKYRDNELFEEKQSKMEKVCKQFEDWRKNRTKRKMPEHLWKSAIELYPEYNICEISKTLHLAYNRLKDRILNTDKKKREFTEEKNPEQPPAFIQWGISGQLAQNEWAIEIENLDGTKMKISGKSSEIPDFISICKNFSRRDL